jgi:hydrogenase nickel incorporation protein HypB
MCTDCGCSIRGKDGHDHHHDHHHGNHGQILDNPHLNDPKTITVIQKILDKNDHEAMHNRAHLDSHKVLGINLMSSPGSGKTTL